MAGGHEDVEMASSVKSNVSLDVWVKENFPKSSAYSMTNDVKKRMETEPLRDNGRQYPEGENGIWPESKDSNVDEDYKKDNGEEEENEDDDGDDYSSGPLGDCVYRAQEMLKGFYHLHGRLVLRIIAALLLALYAAYFVAIIVHNPKKATAIIAITCVCVTGYAIYLINKRWGSNISAALNVPYSRIKRRLGKRKRKILTWVFYGLIAVAILLFLILDVGRQPKRLIPVAGLVILVTLIFLTSTHPNKVRWRPVIWGIGMQFVIGLILLRWRPGLEAFKFIGEQVERFFEHTDAGSKTMFGDPGYLDHPLVMKSLPTVILSTSVIAILYYWGLIQLAIEKMGALMSHTLKTGAVESLNAAANIFLGFLELASMLKPYVKDMTNSELLAILTGGLSTIAGAAIPLFVSYGVPATHLLTGALMSAPAALAVSKLSLPETEKKLGKNRKEDDIKMGNAGEMGEANNMVQAASIGAGLAAGIIATIIVNIIAFLALIEFLNQTLSYLGGRLGFPELSFELICSYIFRPLAAIIGIDDEDVAEIAGVLGTKMIIMCFMAYIQLADLINAGLVTARSAAIATYACCGFGSVGAMGVFIGILSGLEPSRKKDIAALSWRAFFLSNVSCFMTACVAGILYTDDLMGDGQQVGMMTNSTLNGTLAT